MPTNRIPLDEGKTSPLRPGFCSDWGSLLYGCRELKNEGIKNEQAR